jgi:long-chain-alcohol oxidase
LIGELDEKELEILLKTESSIVRNSPEKVKEFGKFDLSKQEDIIDRLINRLSKSTTPHKLQQISSNLRRLSLKGITNKSFYKLTRKQQEAEFIKWSTSQNASFRSIYRNFSMLICSTFWLNPYGFNPTIGYPGADPNANDSTFTRTYPEYNFLEIDDDISEIKDFDTIIVGSGAGGSVAAARLSKMGYNVLVIEKGRHYKQSELSLEQEDGYNKLYECAGGLLSEDNSLHVLAGSNFGGGTTVSWSASMEPQYFVREEWAKKFGLPYFMEDEYGNAMKYINARLGTNTNNIIHNQSNQALIDGCKKLALHVDNLSQNASSIHQCGWCSFGCKNGGKQSAIMTWLSEAKSNNAKFVQDCYAEKVLIEKDGKNQKVVGVEVIISGTKRVKIHAKRVIVASGAIHTPALLLRSGLKNRNIGKNLHVHPMAAVYGVFPNKEIKTYTGTIMSAISNAAENVDGENYGAKIVVGSHHPGFMFSNFPWKSTLQHKQLMLEYNHIVPLMVITRDREGGRILTDTNGKPKLEYKLSQHDSKSMISGLITAIKILVAAGASKIGTCQAGIDDYIIENGVNPLNDPSFTHFLEKVRKVGISANHACISSIEQMSSW